LTTIDYTYKWTNNTGVSTILNGLNYSDSCTQYQTYSAAIGATISNTQILVDSFTVGGILYNSPGTECSCSSLITGEFWVNLVDPTTAINQTDGAYYVSVNKITCEILQISACTAAPPTPPACNNCNMAGISFSDAVTSCPPYSGLTFNTSGTNIAPFNTGPNTYLYYNTSGVLLGTQAPNQTISITFTSFVDNIAVVEPQGYTVGQCKKCFNVNTKQQVTCP
jgi:hypothetical protein